MNLSRNVNRLSWGRILPLLLMLSVFMPVRADAILPILQKSYTLASDYIMYDTENKVAYCEGHSEMTYGLMRIQADNIRVDTHTHLLFAEGKVIIQSMVNRNVRDLSSEGEATILESNIEIVNAGLVTDKDRADAQERIMQENIQKSLVQTFEGDVLLYDLTEYAGVIIKTKDEVSRTYIVGDALDVVANPPIMVEAEYLYEEPYIMTNAWTAKRLRINPGNFFEAWQTMIWFKGNKVIPATIPYYTNTGKGFTPGNLRLKSVRYSSNSNWNVGALYTYSKKKQKKGTVSLDYSGDGKQSYRASLSQEFRLAKSMNGSMSLSNLFSTQDSYNVMLNRNLGGSKRQTFTGSLSDAGGKSLSLDDSRKFAGLPLTTRLTLNKNSGSYNAENTKLSFRLGHKSRYIGTGKKKATLQLNTTLDYSNSSKKDSDTNAFVGVTISKSGIPLPMKVRLYTSLQGGYGVHTDGYTNDSYSYNMKLDRGIMGMSYNVSQNRSLSGTRASQYVSMSVNFNALGNNKLNMLLKSSYDLRRNNIGIISTNLKYMMNKRSTIWTDLYYDMGVQRFSMKNYNLRYDLYGSALNARWYVESNDFMVDVATNF